MPYIFDWFRRSGAAGAEQRREGGMGIGLALVRQLVELHEGRVEAHSEGPGKGARFTVWLPLNVVTPASERHQRGADHGRGKLDGLRVLVVDDSTANADALRDLLQFEGARVSVESNPAKAIDVASRERYDVLISDIAMPDIDGYAMMKAIRASAGAGANVPAIAYSGYSGASEIDRAHAAGFDKHLTKPLDVEKLLKAIEEVSGMRRAAD
jgi:two-component system CheB/CheR fusion protein